MSYHYKAPVTVLHVQRFPNPTECNNDVLAETTELLYSLISMITKHCEKTHGAYFTEYNEARDKLIFSLFKQSCDPAGRTPISYSQGLLFKSHNGGYPHKPPWPSPVPLVK